MTKLLSALAVLVLVAAPGLAQDGKKAKGLPCGKSPNEVAALLKQKGDPEEIGRHFRERHPDGLCHCHCPHEKPQAKDGGGKEGGPKDGGVKAPRKDAGPCAGRTPAQMAESYAKKGFKGDAGAQVAEHFKMHPDGICHCTCGHDKPEGKDGGVKPAPKDAGPCAGRTPAQMEEVLAKKGFKGDAEAHVAEHFKAHPDGVCHCTCGHDKPAPKDGGAKKEGAPACGKFVKQAVGEEALRHFKAKHPDGICHCHCDHGPKEK